MLFDDTVIKINNVSKRYKIYLNPLERLKAIIMKSRVKTREINSLHKISLSIKKGNVVGIIGRNGSGKSTLLQLVAGILTPTEGEIEVRGRVSALLELGSGFNPEFTGRENIFLNASIMGISKEEIENRFNEIKEFSEIGDFIDRPVKIYSSGMFVRLAFSVATLINPDILIVDEALAVGDERFQRKCYNHIGKMRDNGCTILFVSHSMPTIEQLCDNVLLLEKGQAIAYGKPKEVINKYHQLLYSGENDYLKDLNKNKRQPKNLNQTNNMIDSINNLAANKEVSIEQVSLLNENNEETYLYNFNDVIKSRLVIKSNADINDVLVGLKIVTPQGVEVYGTSNKYTNTGIDLKKNNRVEVNFNFKQYLMSGTYHISVAVAKKIGQNDMEYLDKKSDIVMFRVEESPISGTGIANLRSEIYVREIL